MVLTAMIGSVAARVALIPPMMPLMIVIPVAVLIPNGDISEIDGDCNARVGRAGHRQCSAGQPKDDSRAFQ